jgi:hypothetical protein
MTEPTRPTTATDDTWAVLALPPQAAMRHVRLLEALRTFKPDPVTGVRTVEQDRLAAAAGLHLDTLKAARAELVAWGVITYRAGRGRGNNSTYYIRPVPPVKADPPARKGGSPRPPFYTPGKGGSVPLEKGGHPADKRGVAKSSDLHKREHKSQALRDIQEPGQGGGPIRDHLAEAGHALSDSDYAALIAAMLADPKIGTPESVIRYRMDRWRSGAEPDAVDKLIRRYSRDPGEDEGGRPPWDYPGYRERGAFGEDGPTERGTFE